MPSPTHMMHRRRRRDQRVPCFASANHVVAVVANALRPGEEDRRRRALPRIEFEFYA